MITSGIKKTSLIMSVIYIVGCGSSSTTNPNNGNPTDPTNGSFVGLGLYNNSSAYSSGTVNDWDLNINDSAQTFSATEKTTGSIISGNIDSTGAYIFFEITVSNHTNYPVGMKFDGVGVGDKIVFLHFSEHTNNTPEFTTLIKKDICPTSDMNMVWHRIMSPVLANPWPLNDIISDLVYTHTTSSLFSTSSWTTQGGVPIVAEASFLTTPTPFVCINGEIQGTTPIPYGSSYNGYIATDGYVVNTSPNWRNIELGLPSASITDIDELTGNYTGYLVVNSGNAYGFKGENDLLTAHLDFSAIGAVSSIITSTSNSLNGLNLGYLNITTTDAPDHPVDGEINGEFNIFTTTNTANPIWAETLPLGNMLITQTVDQTLADFRGNISCSAHANLDGTNKNLVVCEANVSSTDNPITGTTATTADNLFTLVFVTGEYIPGDDVITQYTKDNDIVTDNFTGLQWADLSHHTGNNWITQSNYNLADYYNTSGNTAGTYCAAIQLGGFNDWRVPTISELQGLVDVTAGPPTINSIFSNTANFHYWSSTSSTSDPSEAWRVNFSNGSANTANKSWGSGALCVR
jgi:hypothetical protein